MEAKARGQKIKYSHYSATKKEKLVRNEMMIQINLKNRNNQFKNKLGTTERYFGRSLQSIKITAKKNEEKAN